MLQFKKAELEDIKIIDKYYSDYKEFSCENTPANIIIWQNQFGFEYCETEGMIFSKVKYGNRVCFCLPVARDMKKAVLMLKDYAKENNIPLCFFSGQGERLNSFMEVFQNEFEFIEKRDSFEYIYETEKMISLSGKKYHGKRNHISAFKRNYDWEYQTLNNENINKAINMINNWYTANKEKEDRFMIMEQKGANIVLENFSALNVKGGILFANGKAVAVTFGSPINSEVFDVCYEKAFSEYGGAYTMINNCFVKNELADYKYVNREDDMGLEGLRRAKLSYYPEILLKKYLIREK